MKLSDTDLKQLDTTWALGLPLLRKDKLLVVLIDDLKEARERLAANSQNSSRPPRTDAPWSSVPATVAQVDGSQTPPDAVADKPQPDAKAPPKDTQDVKTPAQDSLTTTPPAQDSLTTAPPAQDNTRAQGLNECIANARAQRWCSHGWFLVWVALVEGAS